MCLHYRIEKRRGEALTALQCFGGDPSGAAHKKTPDFSGVCVLFGCSFVILISALRPAMGAFVG